MDACYFWENWIRRKMCRSPTTPPRNLPFLPFILRDYFKSITNCQRTDTLTEPINTVPFSTALKSEILVKFVYFKTLHAFDGRQESFNT